MLRQAGRRVYVGRAGLQARKKHCMASNVVRGLQEHLILLLGLYSNDTDGNLNCAKGLHDHVKAQVYL